MFDLKESDLPELERSLSPRTAADEEGGEREMSKRLTVGKWGGEDERACDGCKWFGEPNGCNRKDGACDAYERHQSIYARLTEVEDILYDADGKEVIALDRLRAIAEAERDGRLVVLPVAEGQTAETPDGAAILNCWDIVARVTFCNEKRSHLYWKDKYADFDISDIKRKE